MKKEINLLLLIFISCIIVCVNPEYVYAAEETTEDTGAELENNTYDTGIELIDGLYYFFLNGEIVKETGWYTYDDTYVYVEKEQAKYRFYGDKCFQYTDGEKSMVKDAFVDVNGKIYRFNSSGKLQQGITEIDGDYYFFKNGIYKTNKFKKTGKTGYYFGEDGKAVTNEWIEAKEINSSNKKGLYFYFNESGKLFYKYYNSDYKKASYRETVWIYNKKADKWKKYKDDLIEINGYYYCASSTGELYMTKGWHTLSETKAVWTTKTGKVYRYIYYSDETGCSIYKCGYALDETEEGIVSAKINNEVVYYYIDSDGKSSSETRSYDGYIYEFDEYGRAYDRTEASSLYWDTDEWLERVTLEYLGDKGVHCNIFVDRSFSLAGGDEVNIENSIKYSSKSLGGILLSELYSCADWAKTSAVSGNAVLSDGLNWIATEDVVLNSEIVDFSYDALEPGDIIIYYKKSHSSPSHVSIYLGQYDSVTELKSYLKSIGVSKSLIKSSVKEWGPYYGNDEKYWCIEGGMGSSREIYICNSTYCVPTSSGSEYAKKIVKIAD